MAGEVSPLLSVPDKGPDLLVPPHALPEVLDVCAGTGSSEPGRQEHLVAHLAGCTYCLTAVIFLLCVAQEADHRSDNEDGQAGQVLEQFAHIHRALEAAENERARAEAAAWERMGVYAETIVAIGRAADDEDSSFADLAAHVASCLDCRSCLDGTLAFLADESQDAGP